MKNNIVFITAIACIALLLSCNNSKKQLQLKLLLILAVVAKCYNSFNGI